MTSTELIPSRERPFPGWVRAEQGESRAIWTRPAARVTLEREDVVFSGTASNGLNIEIKLRNPSSEATAPTIARISVAPLGAFVPWQPLIAPPVGVIPPRGTSTLRLEGVTPSPGPPPEPLRLSAPMRLILGAQGIHVSRMEPSVHWAGNLDVFVHDHSVERHSASGLSLAPGALNMAHFLVGGAEADAYMFDVTGDLPVCELRLQRPGFHHRRSIPLHTWVEFPRQQAVWLLTRPTSRCPEGHLQIQVRQRSSGREAIVELGFAT